MDILSHKARKKDKLSIFKSLAKFLVDKNFQMKNQNKEISNYAKRFTKKKGNSPVAHIENSDNYQSSQSSRCKSCKKRIDEVNAGTHKQNVTYAIMLVILLSFVRKSQL